MTELTKLKQLRKNVVDTKAAAHAALVSGLLDAYKAWFKAELELANYLKGLKEEI